MKKFFRSTAFIAAIFATCAWAQDTVKIGMFGPLSGPAATGGISFRNGWEFALKEVNSSGGVTVDGRKKRIELFVEDSQSRPEVGLAAAQKLLTRDNVDIVIGDMVHSDVTLATMELAASYPKFFYTGEAISIEIAKKISNDKQKFANVWKHNFSSDSYASTVHDTLMQLVADGKLSPRTKTAAVVFEDTGFSKPIIEALTPLMEKSGWKISVREAVPIGHSDFYPQISKLRSNNPDYIVSIFTALNSGGAFVKQLKEQGVKVAHIGVNYPTLANFAQAAGSAAEGLMFTPMLWDPTNNPKHADFGKKLQASTGVEPDNNTVDAYCHAMILTGAISRAGSVQAAQLSAAMGKTDFRCLTARWVFDPDTHAPRIGGGFFEVPSGQFQGGKLFAIWPKSAATAGYKAP